jgi:hypothetical protein
VAEERLPVFGRLASPPRGGVGASWFAEIAALLIGETALAIAGVAHRLREVELYYHGPGHHDPFAHREAPQLTCGRWYFHSRAGAFRGGSFKGLDLTFGPSDAFGGILLRTIEAPDGGVISGPSLLVDHVLARTGHDRVATLAAALERREADDDGALLSLAAAPPRGDAILATARVGLSLRAMTAARAEAMGRYVLRPYRFTDAPAIRKGRVHTIVALHQAGHGPEAIAAATGSPRRAVERWLAAYREGLARGRGVEGFGGRALGAADLCRLHGALAARRR